MYLRQLELTNFRNYEKTLLTTGPGRLLVLGGNAQGKSNLLEAIHLLSAGKSSRAGLEAEMIGWSGAKEPQPFARASAEVEREDGALALEATILGKPMESLGVPQRAGKRFKVRGAPKRAVDFVGQLRAVLFTADDLEIVSGSPSVRRQFMDTALSQIDAGYYAASQRYARVTQQRNASLKRIREGSAGAEELTLWDETFLGEGSYIIASRQRALASLNSLAERQHSRLVGEAGEKLEIQYQPQLGSSWSELLEATPGLEEIRSLFGTALVSQRRREIAAGMSLVGPHRDELGISVNGVSAASFASRAQIRTAVLSLRLAQARSLVSGSGDPPVVLLDDIVSELDEQRRRSVLSSLDDFDQVWFTAATGSWLPDDFVAGCDVFQVQSGNLNPG